MLTVSCETGLKTIVRRQKVARLFAGEETKKLRLDDISSGEVRRQLEGMGFDTELAFIDKRRPKDTMNQAVAEEVVGDVDGRVCVIVDDMIDTAGTMCAAVDLLISRGATEVYMAATHGVLSGPAIERLEKANVKEVVITNTIPLSEDKQIDKIKVLSIAPVIAEALDHVFEDASISEMFQGDNF